jgi:GT2 family glycosyltransferase
MATCWAGRAGRDRLHVLDGEGMSLLDMWTAGLTLARGLDPDGLVAFLNNDISIGPGFMSGLARALDNDPALWAVSPNYDGRAVDGVEYVTSTYKRNGLAGFAFMVRAAAFDSIAFDSDFEWWYGDDDLVAQVEAAGGKLGVVGDVSVEHVQGGSQSVRYSRDVLASLARDRARMLSKWGRD